MAKEQKDWQGMALMAVLVITTIVGLVWFRNYLEPTYSTIHVRVDCEFSKKEVKFTGYISERGDSKAESKRVYSKEGVLIAQVPVDRCFFQPVDSGVNIFR